MKKALLCIALVTLLAANAFAQEVAKTLNGTWVSNAFTVQIDFDKGTYAGVAMGKPFDHKLTFVKEMANVVYFKSGETMIIAQLQDNGSLMLTKEGGMPMLVKRAK